MKKNITKIFALSFVLVLSICANVTAQNYYSKPEAVKNLADAARQIASTLPTLDETNPSAYKINKEKLRFIKSMLKEIKNGSTVEQASNQVLPKQEYNKLQPSVRFIDVGFANTTPNRFIRSEVMFLISY